METIGLMIGDWVIAEGKQTQVTDIDEYDGVNRSWIAGCEDGGCIRMENIEPIPLTPEIMEKNGFVKAPHEYEYPECQCWTNDVDGSYSFEIVADEHRKPYILGNGDMGDYEWVNFECKYVHELQHALKLCEIEKEIIL